MRKYLPIICAVSVIIAFLGNSRDGLTYEYDLIKIQSQKSIFKGVRTNISAESKKRYMGAIIINGSPFSLSVIIENDQHNPTDIQIESISVKRKGNSEFLLNLPDKQTIEGSWINQGVISSWWPEPSFSLQVQEQENICIHLTLSNEQKGQLEVSECFLLTRERGTRKMGIKDILNQ